VLGHRVDELVQDTSSFGFRKVRVDPVDVACADTCDRNAEELADGRGDRRAARILHGGAGRDLEPVHHRLNLHKTHGSPDENIEQYDFIDTRYRTNRYHGGMADVRALETFVAVARGGSIMRAAERLDRTQPSISARLLALEGVWATKLFRRHARGMALTPEGARLLPLAEAALQRLVALDRAAGVPVSGEDELRIGAGDALGREIVPRAIARLMRERPALAIRVLEGPAPRLQAALRAGEIDLALVVGTLSGELAGVSFEPLLSSAVELLVPVAERGGREIALERLRDRRLVTLQQGSGFRGHLEGAFEAAGVPFRPAVEVGNLSLVRRFVAAGLGVAPVPSIAFARGRADRGSARLRLRGVPPVPYRLARRSGGALSVAAERLIELLRG